MRSLSQNRWLELWSKLGAGGDPIPVYLSLVQHYNKPHRAYHNCEHILDCLAEFDSARKFALQAEAIEMAIWFHDVIYDAKAKDNEARSAELAGTVIKSANLADSFADSVFKLIMATKHIG